ncbi:DNA phosphorothioation system sulfurtransferase DndC [Pseudomonas aeruginosa]|uniref:DNA phosphorothioation system sulfurtransferase DndC n=1 Tax=Pseudomonas aeruginosa TaxID=287 RepID=UPI0034D2F5E0
MPIWQAKMTKRTSSVQQSAFAERGLAGTINALSEEIRELYLSDSVPWVLGYSGGKDSTATLQLVWYALSELTEQERTKPVYVISTDTLVENPVVAAWVASSLEQMQVVAAETGMPFVPHRLTPVVSNTFWVNLIGKGYPAPRPKFRWCTERLKIRPSNDFITNVVRDRGEVILVLGIRKQESAARARAMDRHERMRVRDRLSPNANLPNSLIYSPVEDWSDDDIWTYLMQVSNPWGYRNQDLLTLYQGASPDGECPLVVDDSTPSCGDSRFGCWVCTMVEQDKSMAAMIQNDQEKEWMLPMLQLRNELDVKDDRHMRDFRRMNGAVQIFHGRTIPGPYTQEWRAHWLRRVLEVQTWIRQHGPEAMSEISLISNEELEEIRRIWVVDKHEIEDLLPSIYEAATRQSYKGERLDDDACFTASDLALLKAACGDDPVRYETLRGLLEVERRHKVSARRAGLFDALEKTLRRGLHSDEAAALQFVLPYHEARQRVADEAQHTIDVVDVTEELTPRPSNLFAS